mmetsp:Transcript_50068/g.56703  ORF Transcript_50068/g.56703 Transcript_50068/m.56703 type:complete len:430 (+) Transcript_50068:72-1361(+)
MFRRLAERVNDAVSNAASSLSSVSNNDSTDVRVEELSAMGFRQAEARHALRLANGDMNRATEWLLENGSSVTTTTMSPSTRATITEEDNELQQAIQASLMSDNTNDNSRQQRRRNPPPLAKQQLAASKNVGRASTNRTTEVNNNNIHNTHPKVKIPKRLSQHDQEDIILRCANRVAPYSLSVDTLLRSLKVIQSNPRNVKFQTIDTNAVAFQRSLNAPGVLDFLKAVNFHYFPNSNNKTLTLSHFDVAAFYLGISALEQIQQQSSDYAKHKTLRLFQKELIDSLATTSKSNDETLARNRYLSKLPLEPVKGGSQITVEFGVTISNIANNSINSDNDNQLTKISRGFDHDDTLGDVINWLGSQASVIPNKLETGEWNLVDRNRQGSEENYKYHRLDISELSDKTLQYNGCWPSGRMAIVPRLKDFANYKE